MRSQRWIAVLATLVLMTGAVGVGCGSGDEGGEGGGGGNTTGNNQPLTDAGDDGADVVDAADAGDVSDDGGDVDAVDAVDGGDVEIPDAIDSGDASDTADTSDLTDLAEDRDIQWPDVDRSYDERSCDDSTDNDNDGNVDCYDIDCLATAYGLCREFKDGQLTLLADRNSISGVIGEAQEETQGGATFWNSDEDSYDIAGNSGDRIKLTVDVLNQNSLEPRIAVWKGEETSGGGFQPSEIAVETGQGPSVTLEFDYGDADFYFVEVNDRRNYDGGDPRSSEPLYGEEWFIYTVTAEVVTP